MARLTLAAVPPSVAKVIQHFQRQAPVKVGALAVELGMSVKISDLPLSVSGTLSIDRGTNVWTIRVNRQEHKNRQRYTIAHEISHYILHRDFIDGEVVDDTFYRSGLSERREYEANALAAEILMPWHLIRTLMSEEGTDVSNLAVRLQVSESAMKIRLGLPT